MKNILTIAAAGAALALSAAPAQAADVFYTSFEVPGLGSGGYAYQGTPPGPFGGSPTVPTNSSLTTPNIFFTGASGIQANNSAWGFAAAPNGTQTAFIQSYNNTGGSISFNLSGMTTGQKYFISFAAAARPGYGANPLTLTGPGGLSTPFSITNSAWGYYQSSFVATGSNGTITFTGASASGDSAVGLDAVTVAVPEPATWAMMLLGFGMMGYPLRRRKPVSSSALLAN